MKPKNQSYEITILVALSLLVTSMNPLQHFERVGLQLIGLVSQKIIRSSEPTELPLQPKSKKKRRKKGKIQPAKLKTRKGGLGKS